LPWSTSSSRITSFFASSRELFSFAPFLFRLELTSRTPPDNCSMDNSPLSSFEGLGIIPVDVLEQGAGATAQFLMDLFNSPGAAQLYRSRLVVVGHERLNKTAALDLLFPLTGWLQSQGMIKKTLYWYRVQGAQFCKFDNPTDVDPHKKRIVILDKTQWDLAEQENFGIKITPKRKGEEVIEFYSPTKEIHEAWLDRINRCMALGPSEAALPKKILVRNATTEEYFAQQQKKGELQLDVWNLSSPHDLDYLHAPFLAKRSIFLVLWRLDEGDEGFNSLRMWFSTLAALLAQAHPVPAPSSGLFSSILVVGLFDSHSPFKMEERNLRAQQVDQLAFESGLRAPLQCVEVNSESLQDIDVVQEAVCRIALSHSHMGERLPKSYVSIWEDLERERDKKRLVPTIDAKDLVAKYFDEALVKRALSVLSLRGECAYFDSPAEVSNTVILDTRFVGREILSDLFHQGAKTSQAENGLLKHGDLVHTWSKFRPSQRTAEEFLALIATLVKLLQRLEVGFVRREDDKSARKKSFMDMVSVIPPLLPPKPLDPAFTSSEYPSKFQRAWPADAPADRPAELERALTFNFLPQEFVGRFLVRLHGDYKDNMLWRYDAILALNTPTHEERAVAWLNIDPQINVFVIRVRGVDVGGAEALLERLMAALRSLIDSHYPTVRWSESAHAIARETPTLADEARRLSEANQAKADQ